MKFKELVDKYTIEDALPILHSKYNDIDDSSYKRAFYRLTELDPMESTKFKINVRHIKEAWNDPELEDEEYDDVTGIIDGEDIPYAIEYVDWKEWLAMEITEESLQNYDEKEILSHCLWEMTWNGFSNEQVNKAAEDMKKRVRMAEYVPEGENYGD